MSNLELFDFQGCRIRVLADDPDNPLWVARDVATALGYRNAADAIKRHSKGVVNHYPLETAGGIQQMRVIAEPDLYRLIVNSELETAQEFERLVFEEILPSIRKRGGYLTPEAVEDILTNPDTLIRLAKDLKAERQRAETEHQRAEHLDGWKRAVEGGDGISPTDFGKKYFSEVPAMQFQEHLYSHGWQIKQIGTRIDRNGKRKNGYDHGKPTAKGRPYIYGHDNGVRGGRRRFTPRIRPQRELELRDRLIAEGLPANEHSTGLIPLPLSKEIINV